jgi:hypothetical protein
MTFLIDFFINLLISGILKVCASAVKYENPITCKNLKKNIMQIAFISRQASPHATIRLPTQSAGPISPIGILGGHEEHMRRLLVPPAVCTKGRHDHENANDATTSTSSMEKMCPRPPPQNHAFAH